MGQAVNEKRKWHVSTPPIMIEYPMIRKIKAFSGVNASVWKFCSRDIAAVLLQGLVGSW
jgi:hypothetical protein